MPAAAIEPYVDAFLSRCDAVRGPDSLLVDEPGIHGVLPVSDGSPARLLVTDDQAVDVLASLMPRVPAGTVSVFAAAPRCTEMLSSRRDWKPSQVTAMIQHDLRGLPDFPLDSALTLRPVRRLADDAVTGVPLDDAVAVALAADPGGGDALRGLAEHLRSMPPQIRLLAAVDDDGVARATSGSGAFGSEATVIFVNTQPAWQRRGIGRAMTAAALYAARDAGATRACLEATDAAIPTYADLGFETVARVTQFYRAP